MGYVQRNQNVTIIILVSSARIDSALPTTQALTQAGQWLLHSGIQMASGGVARFYCSDLRQNKPVSTEITGYHASALIYLYSVTGDSRYLHRAISTARFLVDQAWDRQLQTFPFELPEEGAGTYPPAYFFDCGIIARGLLSVWRVTRDRVFLDAAAACGRSMLSDFDAGFDFHPVLELPSKVPALRDPRWSRSSGCYQLKSALAWLELAEETGESAFRQPYDRLLRQSLQDHGEFLPGHTDSEKVMDRLHAYCYFLEAMLPVAPQRASAQGIQRVAHFLHTIAPTFARSDVYAQLLRVRLYADALDVLPLDEHTAAMEADALAQFQTASDDAQINGGYYFGTKHGQFLPYVNPVSTAFGLQAQDMWHSYQHRKPLPDRRLLI